MQNKLADLSSLPPKDAMPVLVLEAESKKYVIDESLDIMLWALNQNDPENLLYSQNADALAEMLQIINENDEQFKPKLEQYKRVRRFHSSDEEHYRLL